MSLWVYIVKNFKFKNPNPSIFSEFGGELPEILKEMCRKLSYSFWTAHNSAEHAKNMKKNQKVKKQKEELCVPFIAHLIMATLNQD